MESVNNNVTVHPRMRYSHVLVLGMLLIIAGCSQPLNKRESGFLIAGGLGASTGAIIGAAVGHPGAGAAIGGAMGALGGGLIGDQLHGQEIKQTEQQQQLAVQQRELQQQRAELEQLKKGAKEQEIEEMRAEEGRIATLSLGDYKIPNIKDIPPLKTVLVQEAVGPVPFQGKSIGENSITPITAAIANALYDAVGVRISDLPITAEKVYGALQAQRSVDEDAAEQDRRRQ